MISKVLAYITRERDGGTQLLVFKHMDFPEAGVQVPKGTVEPGEAPEIAARREVREESGLVSLDRLEFIGKMTSRAFGTEEEWNFFARRVDGTIAQREEWVHVVAGRGEDEGMRFRYYWVPLVPAPRLAGMQDMGLPLLHQKILNGV